MRATLVVLARRSVPDRVRSIADSAWWRQAGGSDPAWRRCSFWVRCDHAVRSTCSRMLRRRERRIRGTPSVGKVESTTRLGPCDACSCSRPTKEHGGPADSTYLALPASPRCGRNAGDCRLDRSLPGVERTLATYDPVRSSGGSLVFRLETSSCLGSTQTGPPAEQK
jgi:hypothetical protein